MSSTSTKASVWIEGSTRSGKTTRLIQQFCDWAQMSNGAASSHPLRTQTAEGGRGMLVFAATGDTRIDLADRLATATGGQYPFDSATPLGFFQDDVMLFWPLIAQQLDLKVQFPIRLRPETEQELATRLWQPELESGRLHQEGVRDYYMVRRALDLLQLAASAGIPVEDIPVILQAGMVLPDGSPDLWSCIGEVLQRWQTWCLRRGLLTYGIVSDLYWRCLLPHPLYQQRLRDRYQAVLADDVDEYPAIAQALFRLLLDQGMAGTFTFDPNGGLRVGLGADPVEMSQLADHCQQIVHLSPEPSSSLASDWGDAVWSGITRPLMRAELPSSIRSIQTVSRADLLRSTAEMIAESVSAGLVTPDEVAIVGPGLDAIARYTLRTILANQGIAVNSVSDQQPIASSPIVRSLLTLMALVYPGLGRVINREAIAEMLVVLSQALPTAPDSVDQGPMRIDPVRAGLIIDHCFQPDPLHPHLLPATAFPRWDRLGYEATQAYSEIRQWVDTQKQQQQQRLLPTPLTLLDRAIQRFLWGGSSLRYDQLAVLRELVETAQHYWDVDARLRQVEHRDEPMSATVERFIQLLRSGTITADPYPVRPVGGGSRAVTLATIFQYRANRLAHRWQFWLDAGSPLWLTGGGGLYGAPLFLRSWSGRPWSAAEALEANQERLRRNVLALLGRTTERIYLCHSDLATNGQEQAGSLLSLVHSAVMDEPESPPADPVPNVPAEQDGTLNEIEVR